MIYNERGKKYNTSLSKEKIMDINLTVQQNFADHRIPKGTEGFYNTTQFATNESDILAADISDQLKGVEEALRKMKEAIDGSQ
jgi:hypothetical protein